MYLDSVTSYLKPFNLLDIFRHSSLFSKQKHMASYYSYDIMCFHKLWRISIFFYNIQMIIQTMPPLLSLTIFCMVSCNFDWLSSPMDAILLRMPSCTSCSMDLPKIFVCLLLCTYDRRDLRLDFCFDHMDGWAF